MKLLQRPQTPHGNSDQETEKSGVNLRVRHTRREEEAHLVTELPGRYVATFKGEERPFLGVIAQEIVSPGHSQSAKGIHSPRALYIHYDPSEVKKQSQRFSHISHLLRYMQFGKLGK